MPASLTSYKRPTAGTLYSIEFGSEPGGWVKEVDGGHAEAEVITEKIGGELLHKKTLGNVKYNDISFKCGAGMSKNFYDWVEASFALSHFKGDAGRRTGAVVAADYEGSEISRLDFHNGIITEFGMPALDGSSKEPAAMTVKFTPEYTRYKVGGGGKIKTKLDRKQRDWTCANFKINIDRVGDAICSEITKIDALTVKQKSTQYYTGSKRDYRIEPTSLETPNLSITIAENFAHPFFEWYEEIVVKGQTNVKNETTASIQYLPQNVSEGESLFRIDLTNVMPFKFVPEKVDAGGDKIRQVKIELTCERITFKYTGGWM